MKEWTVVYSDAAEEDVRGIGYYIAEVLLAPETSKDQILRIMEQVSELNFMPERFPIYDTDACKELGLRRMNVDNFAVLYFVNEDNGSVSIVRVFYGGRDIDAILLVEAQ